MAISRHACIRKVLSLNLCQDRRHSHSFSPSSYVLLYCLKSETNCFFHMLSNYLVTDDPAISRDIIWGTGRIVKQVKKSSNDLGNTLLTRSPLNSWSTLRPAHSLSISFITRAHCASPSQQIWTASRSILWKYFDKTFMRRAMKIQVKDICETAIK